MKACIKCGSNDRYERGDCRPCAQARSREYRKSNPEKVAASDAAYRASNADKIRKQKAEYYARNAEHFKSLHSDYYSRNKEKWLVYGAKRREDKASYRAEKMRWRSRNREKLRSMAVEFRKNHPEKVSKSRAAWEQRNPHSRRIRQQNRRDRKSGGRLSPGIVGRLFLKQKGRCPCCRMSLGTEFHMDHIVPLASGGLHADENMQLLRAECNLKKAARDPIEFMQERGFLL